MRTSLVLILLGGCPAASPAATGAPPDEAPSPDAPEAAVPSLDDLQWKRRVTVLFAAEAGRSELVASQRALAARSAGVEDRRLQVVAVVDGEPVEDLAEPAARLRERLGVDGSTPFEAVLVGLDGQVKARTREAVDVPSWFARIDAMPMRQRELRRRGD
jgi:hypothetical protein